jgi:hypothetical protein
MCVHFVCEKQGVDVVHQCAQAFLHLLLAVFISITLYLWAHFRLSSIAGDKLRVNNPGIADLSDENRPNKLGEKFNELYDNEWTEAYENLDEADLDEEEIIKELLDILKVSA